jgi:integrase
MATNHVETPEMTAETSSEAGRKSTRQLLAKINNVPNLYRHTINGTYYGIRKLGNKRKEHSLATSDRKIAERKLAAWIKNLGKLDPEVEATSLNQLIEKFRAANVTNPDRGTDESMILRLKDTWAHDMDIRVSRIKPSHLDEWLAMQCKDGEWRNTTYNKYCTFLRRLFIIATSDKMIAESPMDGVKVPWKRPQNVTRRVPTLEQFHAIVNDIRSQKLNADAEDSADFIEFMGHAGLGQAEVNLHAFKWSDINWERGIFSVLRKKTQQPFDVPIYPNLRPLLERLAKKPHEPHDSVLKIADAKKALAGACKRLDYMTVEKNGKQKPMFSQRNVRAVQIRRLWRDRVDVKLISKFQGHQDGGRLILNTYTEVFGAGDDEYVKAELAKIKC